MRTTKQKLRQIIKEELLNVLAEQAPPGEEVSGALSRIMRQVESFQRHIGNAEDLPAGEELDYTQMSELLGSINLFIESVNRIAGEKYQLAGSFVDVNPGSGSNYPKLTVNRSMASQMKGEESSFSRVKNIANTMTGMPDVDDEDRPR